MRVTRWDHLAIDDSSDYKLVVACFREDPFPELMCDENVLGMVGEVGDYRPWYRFDPSMTGVAVVSISDGWLTVPHSVNAGLLR